MKITNQTPISLKLALTAASLLLIGAGTWYGLQNHVNANSAAISSHERMVNQQIISMQEDVTEIKGDLRDVKSDVTDLHKHFKLD